ncbi:MAG: hypothetical protein IPJ85_17540 [Flavobacteriales bacterium]|nr:hypothetical protein [Flavobacteriales bacterium]
MSAKTERERLEQVLQGQADFLHEVHEMLADEQRKDDQVRHAVRTSKGHEPVPLNEPEPWRVYSIESIEALCIKYRLRFLAGCYFKGAIPGSAVLAIRRLEARFGQPVSSYCLMAPSAQFKLCDSEVDPLLFLPLGEGRYYLVSKWGNDLSWMRSIAFWPVRKPLHLAATILMAAILLTITLPESLLGDVDMPLMNGSRAFFLFWISMVLSGFTLFGWFAFFGQFSKESWNSRYFN